VWNDSIAGAEAPPHEIALGDHVVAEAVPAGILALATVMNVLATIVLRDPLRREHQAVDSLRSLALWMPDGRDGVRVLARGNIVCQLRGLALRFVANRLRAQAKAETRRVLTMSDIVFRYI